MNRSTHFGFTLLFLFVTTLTVSAQDEKRPGYYIHNVTVIDVERGMPIPQRTVQVAGDEIAMIVDSALIDLPKDANIVDGSGLFLIPGLFDAHVHLTAGGNTFGPLLVAHGITCVRDTGAATEVILHARKQAADGTIISPEILCTGAIIDGDPPVWPFSEACDTPEDARAAVQKLHKAGVDQIKVYSLLKPEVYRAAIDEAHKLGLKATGHVPNSVTLHDAMKAGQDCNEHLTGFAPVIAAMATGDDNEPDSDVIRGMLAGWMSYDKIDRAQLDEFLTELKNSNMMQCPTIVVMQGIGRLTEDDAENDPRLQYIPAAVRSFWSAGTYKNFSAWAGKAVPHMQAMVAELHRAKVPMMIGTDLGNPYVFAGSSVHDEMMLFQDAGIPAADVLRMATIVPAQFCGVDDRLGTIAKGKTASLVLLRGNPLDDAKYVSEVEAVFLAGRYFDRASLDGLLNDIKKSASGSGENKPAIKLELPGTVINRGRYAATFQDVDGGVEDYLITKTDDGYHVIAHNQPTAGIQFPSITTVHVDKDFAFQSAIWEQLSDSPVIATYTVKDGKLTAEATQDGKSIGTQERELPPNAVIGAPAFATEFTNFAGLRLDVGESAEYLSVNFGYPSWNMTATPYTMTRHEDTKITVPARGNTRARHYSLKLSTPMGEVSGQTWTDENGLALRSIIKFPFGTIEVVLQSEES